MGTAEGAVTAPRTAGYVGRFAPSPTGPLHFGSLVAAMASYVDARANDGRWLVRIEDVDTTRCSVAAERVILNQLAAYGLTSDVAVVRQRERATAYEAAIKQLQSQQRVYGCACTRRQLESAPRNSEGEVVYPGSCRDRGLAWAGHALRLRVPPSGADEITFNDRLHGLVRQRLSSAVGDFVLRRADGIYSYQLAVVVDDHLQGVTHVVRGADLLGNTARQCYLQHCLGYPQPAWMHVPVARNAAGEKLSKQTQAQPLATDNVLPALQQAWAFLRQRPMAGVDTIKRFWARAASEWSPARLMMPSTDWPV